jgi:predicted Zn finger-like uncharacterized protein
MKITCQSCQAKYTIADDKVLGKIVKIRCKKCSSTIVVNGSDASGAPRYGAPEGADAAAMGSDEAWTVNVGDGDQRTLSDAEIVAAFHAGTVTGETFCWRDGMNDWLPLREIESLVQACNAAAQPASLAPEAGPTRVHGRAGAPSTDYAAAAGNGAANGGAARRATGRAGGADLFHGAAQAGGEEEVMTSAPQGAPQAYDEQKPTGARNENSVLFSLSALTSKGNDRPPPVPGVEASGLIDIRQLSAQMGSSADKKKSRVDDIMNLSSGGAFNAALAAPVLSAPALDQYGPPAGEAGASPSGKNKSLIFLALGGGAFVIVAAIGATMLLMKGKSSDADSAAASASAAGLTAPAGSAAAATATGAAAAATATGAATGTATGPAAAAAPEPTAAATETAAAAAPAATTAAPTPVAAPAPAPKPVVHEAASPAPAPKPAPTPVAAAGGGDSDQAFNMGEAKAKLAAAATAAQSCKKGDGPVGTGRVVVVFAPSGGAQTAPASRRASGAYTSRRSAAARSRSARASPSTDGGSIGARRRSGRFCSVHPRPPRGDRDWPSQRAGGARPPLSRVESGM